MAPLIDVLLTGLARTTLCTTAAALAATLLLPRIGSRAPRMHRTVWILVMLQGWILVPYTFQVALPQTAGPPRVFHAPVAVASETETTQPRPAARAAAVSSWQRWGRPTAVAAWLLGTVFVLCHYLMRYYTLITYVPLGSAPEAPEWSCEWREALSAVAPWAKVQLRVTRRTGPLLCFVPLAYFVLVPKVLWASLSHHDRSAVLRHELTHLRRGDLWKNLIM